MKKMKMVFLVSAAAVSMMGCKGKTSVSPTAAETKAESTAETGGEIRKEEADESTMAEVASGEETEEMKSTEITAADTESRETAGGELSEDLYSFQISIDGTVYQFPMKYSDFVASGWVFDGNENSELDSMFRAGTQVFNKGKLQCYATIMNFDINARPFRECYITGIQIDKSQNKNGAEILLPKGIQLGKSTREDIRTAYGESTEEYQMENGSGYYRYNRDIYQGVELSFFQDEKELYQVSINNIAEPADLETSEVSEDVPDIVSQYQAPTDLTADFSEFTVKYGDSLYRLPAPVSEFEKNGWQVQEDKSDLQIAGRDFGWVTMMKDNQVIRVIANNYSSEAVTIRNCFVQNIVSDDSRAKIPLVISGGITTGMKEEELLQAISGQDYEKTEDTDFYACYKITPGSSALDSYEVYVHKSDQKVYKISVNNAPKFNQIENWLSH